MKLYSFNQKDTFIKPILSEVRVKELRKKAKAFRAEADKSASESRFKFMSAMAFHYEQEIYKYKKPSDYINEGEGYIYHSQNTQ